MHPGIRKYFVFQAILSVSFILLMTTVFGKKGGLSALVASVCYLLPNLLFARQLFYYHGAQAAKKIVKGFYRGEAIKLISTVVLIGVVFALLPVKPLPFFLTFIVLQMSIWVAPLFVDTNRRKGQKSE
ncbi:ATP synthase subunit I [Legionella sp. W05-934-2]|uniref:ATP synthase subunit I n=1 Tax=Legionella sp. W05-934-2 TaxID=1198649 RepID=UPI003461A27E